MQEKEIIKAEKMSIKKLCSTILICGALLTIFANVMYALTWSQFYLDSFITCFFEFAIIIMIPVGIVDIVIYNMVSKTELVITDKRVYGKAMFGKRVDLPVDSISAVGTSMLNGVSVATSAGKIQFLGMMNRDDIHKVLSDLIVARQNRGTEIKVDNVTNTSNADELKKYKDLLDSGVITQEEFDAKKKQLLGL